MNNEQLIARVIELERFVALLQTTATFPLPIQRALESQGFFRQFSPLGTGVLYSTSGVIAPVTGASSGFYVSLSSGGPVTHFAQATNGIITTI